MKTLFYQENTITLFKYLKHHPPESIFSDQHIQVIFDYGNFHISTFPDAFVAASQNKSDEIIRTKFESINSVFQPSEDHQLLFKDKVISRLWILRTLLYFTDYIAFNNEFDALRDCEIKTEPNKILADLMSTANGGYEEVVCHPQSKDAKSVNQEFTNLVDAGIMLEIDSQLLMCFSWNNAFCTVGRIMLSKELKEEVIPFYEFIEI